MITRWSMIEMLCSNGLRLKSLLIDIKLGYKLNFDMESSTIVDQMDIIS